MDDSAKPALITVQFDAAVYSLTSIKKALYRISDSVTAEITIDGNAIRCALFPLPGKNALEVELTDRLRCEVLDQDLRERIAAESKPYRDVILGYVFSKTGLQSDEQVS